MVGIESRRVMGRGHLRCTASSTSAKQPASSRAIASRNSRRAVSAWRPWALWPPIAVAVCGVRPRWPITGMPAATSAFTRSSDRPGALQLDHVGAALLDQPAAVRTASSSDTW